MKPELGMGGTLMFLNDRVPVTVTRILSEKRILIRRDSLLGTNTEFAISYNADMVEAMQLWVEATFKPKRKVTAVETGGTQGNNGFKIYIQDAEETPA